jgi:hypothetical protein
MPDDGLPNPLRYVVPKGFIELRSAYDEVIKARFGPEWSLFMSPAELESEAAKPGGNMFRHVRAPKDDVRRRRWEIDRDLARQSRQRRWEIARKCALRAFRRRMLETFVLVDGAPRPLDPHYWDGWIQSWRPFAEDPWRNPELPIYLIRHSQLRTWIKADGPTTKGRYSSDAIIRGFVESAYSEDIASGRTPVLTGKHGLQERAEQKNVHAQRKRLQAVMKELDARYRIQRGRGRPTKNRRP